jgi:hypothetical protein
MRMRLVMGFMFPMLAMLVAGCTHRLVAPQGETTVAVYPDKTALQKVAELKKQSGVFGKLGNLGETIVATQVPAGTAVKILNRDPDSVEIEVSEGSDKGLHGYVKAAQVD